MVVTNTIKEVKSAIRRNKHKISNNAIVDIHAIRTNNKLANKVEYDRIVGIISDITNKNVHFFVNSNIKRADIVIIKIYEGDDGNV